MNSLKLNYKYIVMIGLMGLAVFLFFICDGCPKRNLTVTPTPIGGVDDAIQRSANYLMKITGKDGMFEYRINLDPTIRVKKKYNIVRHAGAIYAMAMYYERHPDDAMRAAIERAGRYLRNEAVSPVPEDSHMLAVWSKPEVNRSRAPLQVKLGGAGLGLVALTRIEKISPGFTQLSDLKALGRFIVYMQKEDGSFYSKYIPSMGGKQDNWQSLYYPGEAVLGLMMLYELDPSPVWLKSACRTLEYLARTRENKRNIPADHWALLATEKILSLEHTGEVVIDREQLVNHAVQICDNMLREQVDDPERPKYDGGFAEDGRTTPTATRLEGLIAALSFLPPDGGIRKRIEASVTRGIAFLIRAQVKEGEYEGAMPRAVGLIKGNGTEVWKFNRRSSEIRIDYIQHAMSAMMQYQQQRVL